MSIVRPTGPNGAQLPVLASQASTSTALTPVKDQIQDRVLDQPEYYAHLTKDLPETHPAKRLGVFENLAKKRDNLITAIQTSQAMGKAKLITAASLGATGIGIVSDALFSSMIGHGPSLAIAGLGIGTALYGLSLILGQTQIRRDIAKKDQELEKNISQKLRLGRSGTSIDKATLRKTEKELPDISRLPEWLRDVWVPIPAGEFAMGSNDGHSDEKPVRKVIVSAFYMMNTTVTNEMWERVTGKKSPSPSGFNDPKQPVVKVSFHDAVEFVRKLNELVGGKVRFDLPTEAEWEYAAKGGQNQKWAIDPNAQQITPTLANYGNTDGKTTPVGSFPANGFGLFDMSGNVWEWCMDWYGNYTSEEQINPQGPSNGNYRVLRGGSWYSIDFCARSANRRGNSPGISFNNFGFRLVVAPRTS